MQEYKREKQRSLQSTEQKKKKKSNKDVFIKGDSGGEVDGDGSET